MQFLCVILFAVFFDKQLASAKQYQHWVPQFIVRNFAAENRKTKSAKSTRVNFYDKTTETAMLVLAKDIFGAYDLYEDPDTIFEIEAMEKKFSKLEGDVSQTIKNVVEKNILPKDKKELFNLQKFLFTLTLRKESFRNFFNRGLFNAETENSILKYMEQHGLKSTHQIWIKELDSFLSLENKQQISRLKGNLFHDFYETFVEYMEMNVQIWKVNPRCDGELFLSDSNMGKWVGTPNAYEKAVIRYFFPIHPKIGIVVEADKKAFQKRCQKIGLAKTSYLHMMGVSDVPMLPQTNKIMNQNAVDEFNDVLFDDANIRHGIVFRTLSVFQKSKIAKGKNIVVKKPTKIERKEVQPFRPCDYTTYKFQGSGPQQTFYCMFCGETYNCSTDFCDEETQVHGNMHQELFDGMDTQQKLQTLQKIKSNLFRYHTKLIHSDKEDPEINALFIKAIGLLQSVEEEEE